MTRLHVQVVGRLHALPPAGVVHRQGLVDVPGLQVHVPRQRLVDPLLRPGGHFHERVRRGRERGLVDLLDLFRNLLDLGQVALMLDDPLADLVPEIAPLQLVDQVVVDVEVLAGELAAREDLREPRVDARRGAGHQTDVGVRGHGHQGGVADPFLHLLAKRVPVEVTLFGGRALPAGTLRDLQLDAALLLELGDRIHRDVALGPFGALEVRIGAAVGRQIGALVDRVVADELEQAVGQLVGLRAVVGEPEPLDGVGQAHHAEPDGAVLLVGTGRLRNRQTVDVDQVVEMPDAHADGVFQALPVELLADRADPVGVDVGGDVDRRQVADGDVLFVLRQADLGAEVRHVDRTGVVVERPQVDRVLPGQPRVRGRLERHQDLAHLLLGRDLPEVPDLAVLGQGDVLGVALAERLAVELRQVRHFLRIEHVPAVPALDALHELVGEEDGRVGGPHAEIVVTGVMLPVDVIREVDVPVLHVEA